MGRTTIQDVARRAGVSTATVDRALNGRAGVSAANRQRVLAAARALGYLPSEGMVALPARPAHLEFLVPFPRNAFMADLAAAIRGFAASLPLVASCEVRTLEGIGPDSLIPALEKVSLRTSGVGLVTIDHPRTRHAIRRLCEAGVRVVTMASDVLSTPRAAYVGVDNRIAGRTAAQIMGVLAGGRPGSVALFLGSRAFHGHQEREIGFRAVLEERSPQLRLLPAVETGEDSTRSRAALQALLRNQPDLAGVYCVGAGRAGLVEALRTRGAAPRPAVVLHELTDSSRGWLVDDLVDVVIDQNARLVGEQAVIRLLGAIAASAPLPAQKDIEPRIVLRENIPSGALWA
jgi:LacI family transcriptional regulator